MTFRGSKSPAAFTLVEILIGASLALMVMTAVLSTYVTIGRNFTRSLGVSSANQPTLDSQARRTLAYFAQDARMASTVSAPSSPDTLANAVTLTLPASTGSASILYYYNPNSTSRYLHSNNAINPSASSADVEFKANTLTRVNLDTRAYQLLHSNLLTCTFAYYDNSGVSYSSSDLSAGNYTPGIKEISLSFSAQAGSSTNGTLTAVYQNDSPRIILRNRSFLQ